jgi:hypothetical protein
MIVFSKLFDYDLNNSHNSYTYNYYDDDDNNNNDNVINIVNSSNKNYNNYYYNDEYDYNNYYNYYDYDDYDNDPQQQPHIQQSPVQQKQPPRQQSHIQQYIQQSHLQQSYVQQKQPPLPHIQQQQQITTNTTNTIFTTNIFNPLINNTTLFTTIPSTFSINIPSSFFTTINKSNNTIFFTTPTISTKTKAIKTTETINKTIKKIKTTKTKEITTKKIKKLYSERKLVYSSTQKNSYKICKLDECYKFVENNSKKEYCDLYHKRRFIIITININSFIIFF